MREWLRQKLYSFLHPDEIHIPETNLTAGLAIRESDRPEIDGMRFTIMVADGGTIIQMRTYDRRKDESQNRTYVIPESEPDIANRIGQIVSIEMLKL